jgi:ribonuclease E
MSKKMMVNATHPEENRVAIVEDGILTELDIEVAGREPSKGNIYKAVVVRVETGLQAAFVDYGAERLGFLQIDEINYSTVKPDYKPAEDGRRPRIGDLLSRGQELLVQITKEERGTKGAALTTYVSLAGRYMVLMPDSQTRGVSRKAESDSQRKALKKAMNSLDLAEGVGYIVRTAALDQTREELERDYRYLIRLFESIKKLDQKAKAPALIYKESNLMIRSIRDYFTTDMDEVLIDDPQVFKEARDFFQMVMPDQVKLVKQHRESRPIFSRYQIEDQIETLSRNKVALPSGGSIVIDPTEALVAIDVNSGKMASEKGVEATATKTNLEAAEEVGRQLRLRDLGGLIVIDFIDMRERKHMRQVENQVKKSLENDKARVNVGRISQFGLLEMSRQRIKAALTEGSHLTCPHCNGSGHLKSPETQGVALLRKIHASAAKGQVGRVDAQLPIEVAAYLLNNKREELVDMERRYQLQIHVHGNRDFLADQIEIEIQKKEKGKAEQQEFVAASSLSMDIEEDVQQDKELPVPHDVTESEAEPAKKRRRRRRRKSSAASSEESQAKDQAAADKQDDTTAAEETTAPAVTTTESPAEGVTEQAEAEAPKNKPQRRRRSSSKAKAAATDADATEAPAVATAEAGTAETPSADADESAETTTDEQPPVEKKPKRRSRRKPKAAEDAEKQEVATESAEQPQPEVKQTEQPVVATPKEKDAEAEAKPKPKRTRRPARKKPQTDAEAESTSQEEVVSPEPASEEKPVAKKPARRSRTKRDDAQKPTEKATTTAKSVKETEAAPAEETKDEKPKRRRTSRAKPKATEATAEQEEKTVEKSTEEKPVKKAPARRTTRKTPTKKAVTVKKKDEAVVEKEDSAKEEKAKPKRRRTVKKKPPEADPSATDQ